MNKYNLKKIFSVQLILLITATLGTSPSLAMEPTKECERLKKLPRRVLNSKYINGSVDRAPSGEYHSCELARPSMPGNVLVRSIANLSWNGANYFENGTVEIHLLRSFLRINAIGKFSVDYSEFDNEDSFVNNYSSFELPIPFPGSGLLDKLTHLLRDEFREIEDGVYLGMTFARLGKNSKHSEYVGHIALVPKK